MAIWPPLASPLLARSRKVTISSPWVEIRPPRPPPPPTDWANTPCESPPSVRIWPLLITSTSPPSPAAPPWPPIETLTEVALVVPAAFLAKLSEKPRASPPQPPPPPTDWATMPVELPPMVLSEPLLITWTRPPLPASPPKPPRATA